MAHSPLAATASAAAAVAEVNDDRRRSAACKPRPRPPHRTPWRRKPCSTSKPTSGQYLSNGVIVHNCFIQSVSRTTWSNPGGIMDLWTREARLFKYGSGTGSNFSQSSRRERVDSAAAASRRA